MPNNHQTILAVESSTKACSVSLSHHNQQFSEFEIAPQQHANLMLGMVESVMKQASITGAEIDGIALCEGPGAFTGVRIAAGVVQGLAYGWQKPVQSISSLEALAWQAYEEFGSKQTIACMDARMQEMYLQSCEVIDGKLYAKPAKMVSAEDAEEIIIQSGFQCGIGDIQTDFLATSQLFKQWHSAYPNAEYIAKIANQRTEQFKSLQEKIPLPVYLRNNIAVKKGQQK